MGDEKRECKERMEDEKRVEGTKGDEKRVQKEKKRKGEISKE
jgi:hypothetical protein